MQNAVKNMGYESEGITGYIFIRQEPQTIPLYRLYSARRVDHLYTIDPAERDRVAAFGDYVDEGIAGYVYGAQVYGSEPLYRLYTPGATNHFYTMSVSERDNARRNLGYTFEGVVGYILVAV